MELDHEAVATLLAFLPRFERGEFSSVLDRYRAGRYPKIVDDLHRTVMQSGLVVLFDWPSWPEEARNSVADLEKVTRANLEEISKLLTLHIRQDRFSGGHLASVCSSGHLAAVLRRLRRIVSGFS